MNLIFDLDGTLIDSKEDIMGAVKAAYREIGREVEMPESHIGMSIKDIFSALTPDIKDTSELIKHYRYYYDNCMHLHTYLYENVQKLFPLIQKSYLVTNKPERVTRNILKKFGLNFRECLFSDSFNGLNQCGNKKHELINMLVDKYELDKNMTAYIGDTAEDIDAARMAGICSIAVTYGYGNIVKLLAAKPSVIITEPAEILRFGR